MFPCIRSIRRVSLHIRREFLHLRRVSLHVKRFFLRVQKPNRAYPPPPHTLGCCAVEQIYDSALLGEGCLPAFRHALADLLVRFRARPLAVSQWRERQGHSKQQQADRSTLMPMLISVVSNAEHRSCVPTQNVLCVLFFVTNSAYTDLTEQRHLHAY